MAIITNTARDVQCKIDSKGITWGDSQCLIPIARQDEIKSQLGDIDYTFLIAFNEKEMANESDDSKPYAVVFYH